MIPLTSVFLTGFLKRHNNFYLYFTEVVFIMPISLLKILRAAWQ